MLNFPLLHSSMEVPAGMLVAPSRVAPTITQSCLSRCSQLRQGGG